MLLEDYSSKLSLGNYKTIQITRTLGGDRDETSHIELMVFSENDSYHLTKEESSKVRYLLAFKSYIPKGERTCHFSY